MLSVYVFVLGLTILLYYERKSYIFNLFFMFKIIDTFSNYFSVAFIIRNSGVNNTILDKIYLTGWSCISFQNIKKKSFEVTKSIKTWKMF